MLFRIKINNKIFLNKLGLYYFLVVYLYYQNETTIKKSETMKTLSNNTNGKVLKSNNNGYSSNREYKRIAKFLKDNNVSFDFDRSADFSSFYLDFVINNIWLNVRISDHTKRGYDLDKTIEENNKTFENIKSKEYYSGNLQVLNTEMFKSVFNVLKSI